MIENKLFDPIRKVFIKSAPEELVRQKTLQKLIAIGYPPYLLGVEKPLSKLCKVLHGKIPNRKVDIVCFSKKDGAPFVLIECKAAKITQKAVDQVMGYNRIVQAPYIVVIGIDQVMMGYWDHERSKYEFIDRILPYNELIK